MIRLRNQILHLIVQLVLLLVHGIVIKVVMVRFLKEKIIIRIIRVVMIIRILKDIKIIEKRIKTIIHLIEIDVIFMMKVMKVMDIEIFGGFIFQEGEDND